MIRNMIFIRVFSSGVISVETNILKCCNLKA